MKKIKTLMAVLVGAAILIGPAFGGDRNDVYKHPEIMCKGKMKAKNIPAAAWKAELDKCLNMGAQIYQ
jgi:hypothetical protein